MFSTIITGISITLLLFSASVSPADGAASSVAATQVALQFASLQRRLTHLPKRDLRECNDTSTMSTADEFLVESLENATALSGVYKDLANSLLRAKIIFGFDVGDQYFGHNGEYTDELKMQHATLSAFWKMEVPVLLFGLHSENLISANVSEIALEAWSLLNEFNITEEEIPLVAVRLRQAIETELLDSYASPALTFEAYATFLANNTDNKFTPYIVIGDGLADFQEFLEIADVGIYAVHAHEFAHTLQFVIDIEDAGGDVEVFRETRNSTASANATRYRELEADAMGAYALAHEQGRNFPVAKLVEAAALKTAVGDCNTTSLGHHGTPKQRSCATKWGASEGFNMTGDPVDMREFRARFRESYELILATDPSVCTLTRVAAPVAGAPVAGSAPAGAPVAVNGGAPTSGSPGSVWTLSSVFLTAAASLFVSSM